MIALLRVCAIAAIAVFACNADSADHLTVSQWALIQPDVGFVAHVVIPTLEGNAAAHRVVVTLRGRDGVYYEGTSDPAGIVAIPHVSPGVYVLTAHGEGTFACYALHLLDESTAGHQLYPDSVEIPLAPLPFTPHVDETVRPLIPSEYGIDSLEILGENVEKVLGHARGNELFRVRRTESGSLVGRIYQATDHGVVLDDEDLVDRLDPAEGTHVFVFHQDQRIGRDLTSENGHFEFPAMASGIYSMIAVGPDGVAVLGFELVEQVPELLPTPVTGIESDVHFVNQTTETDSEFAVQVIPMTIAQWNGEMGMDCGCGCEEAPPAAPGGGGAAAIPPPPLAAAALGAALVPGGGGGFIPVPPASPDTVP